jgi:hypothetical protein
MRLLPIIRAIGFIAVLPVFAQLGCGGSQYNIHHAETDEEFEKRQEEEGDKAKQRELEEARAARGETEEQKKRKFDEDGASAQLKRKAELVVGCPDSAQAVGFPGGKYKAAVTWDTEGKTKLVVVTPEIKESVLRDCVEKAFHSSIKPYGGAEQTRDQEFELPASKAVAPQDPGAKDKDKKKKGK